MPSPWCFGAVHMLHIEYCDPSCVVLLKPVGFPAVCAAKALGWRFWDMCYKAASVYHWLWHKIFASFSWGHWVCALPLAPKVLCTQQEVTLPVWSLYNSRLLLMCMFRLAPAAGSWAARSHQWSFCFLSACFPSPAHSSCCEMLHFSPRSQREACA